MNNCPQCGKPLPLQNMKFCPECGCNLSAQSVEDYDVICPDCNTVITDENSDCPNCGCPPNLFTKRVKAKFLRGETLECPDCGMVFEDTIPTECPNCGCPSERYKLHTDDREVENEPAEMPQNKSIIKSFLIIFLIIGVGLLFIYNANEKREKEAERARQEQYAAEQAKQEQYAKKQQEREEREAAERLELERKRYNDSRSKWKEFSGTTYRASQWVSDRIQYYAFGYNRSGKGKYFIYCNYPGTNVVEDKMEFSIYKVESEGNYLYLYSYELNSPVKIKIQGSSLYTMNGDRYEIW